VIEIKILKLLLPSWSEQTYNKQYQNGTDDVQRIFPAIRQKANENTHGWVGCRWKNNYSL